MSDPAKADSTTVATAADLADATALELWNELRKRHTGMVIAFDRKGKVGDKTYDIDMWWHGCSLPHALGLATMAVMELREATRDLRSADVEGDRDEDEDDDARAP